MGSRRTTLKNDDDFTRLIRRQSLSLFNYDVRAIVVEFAGVTILERGIRNSVYGEVNFPRLLAFRDRHVTRLLARNGCSNYANSALYFTPLRRRPGVNAPLIHG